MEATEVLDGDVSLLPSVSGRAATVLRTALGVRTVRDLLEHYPHQDRYRDVGAQVALADATPGEPVTIVGEIGRWQVARPRGRRMTIAKALLVADGGGTVEVPFFNQEWRAKATPAGRRVAVSGVLERFRTAWQMKNARLVELGPGETGIDGDRVVATYPATSAGRWSGSGGRRSSASATKPAIRRDGRASVAG
jgi:ATP-dependent DNA helicase RecG